MLLGTTEGRLEDLDVRALLVQRCLLGAHLNVLALFMSEQLLVYIDQIVLKLQDKQTKC